MQAQNKQIAYKWIDAFNRKNLDALLDLYSDKAMHYSPKLKVAKPETNGFIRGREMLRAWWKDAFDRLPTLQYDLTKLTADDKSVFMEYTRRVSGEADLKVGEVLEIEKGLIVASRVYHG
jgi:ketosteroid isomerase-like protein